MATGEQRQSRIPSHLRPFIRSAVTDLPQTPKSLLSHDIPIAISAESGVELCPPHWRRRNPSLRSKVKAVILKQWPDTRPELQTAPVVVTPLRPKMRMKDSEDYITARAANPWTGVVSPSVGTPSPCTPNSPGEALQLSVLPLLSSKSQTPARPILSRTNEVRKVVTNAASQHHPNVKGWFQVNRPPASSYSKAATASTEIVAVHTPSKLQDDQFIVHMPSAREPQPYAYPGRTPEQIQALESHRVKTFHASNNDQIDHPSSNGRPMNKGQEYKGSAGSAYVDGRYQRTETHGLASPVDISSARWNIAAAKPHQSRRDMLGQDLGEARLFEVSNTSASRTRFQSPVKLGHSNAAFDMHPAPTRDMRLGTTSVHHAAPPRPSINSNITTAPCDDIGPDSTDNYLSKINELNSRRTPHLISDLKQLPKVMLLHPDLAGLPRATLLGSREVNPIHDVHEAGVPGGSRSNTAANIKDDATYQWQSQVASVLDGVPNDALFVDKITPKTDTIIGLVLCLSEFLYDMSFRVFGRLPRISCLEALASPMATKKQKIEALKSLMSLTGRIMAIFMAVTVVWQIGSVVLGFLELLLFPVKIIMWLATS